MYQLGNQFEVDYEKGKAPSIAVINGANYRITILTERLIRLEYSNSGSFVDGLTQLVMNRNFKAPIFDIKQDDKFLEIKTKYFLLQYIKEKPFFGGKLTPMNNLKVTLLNTGENEKIWYYGHPEVRNFGSSGISLDESADKVIYRKGIYSQDGFASLDDSNGLIINEDGTLSKREDGNIDIYLFMYKNDFYLALNDYFNLTGRPPLIPRYALGNWWSREKAYNFEDIKDIVDNFEKENVPISIFMLDKDWHIRNTNDNKKLVTGFTFNKELIPNPVSTIEYLHSKNIRVGLAINPIEGIYPHEEYYTKAIEYLNVEAGKIITFDPLNPKLLDVYLKLFIHPLEAIGIDFFWNDYDEMKKVLPFFALNHYHYLDSGRNPAKRNMMLARNSLTASHRYPIHYSGKTNVSWDTLGLIPYYNANASNIGLSWWSHDVGGFTGGIEDPELYIRYVELSTFSPILRFHAAGGKYYKREPWNWDIKTETVVNEYLRLRHTLIPYIYTEAYRYHKEGYPLVQPLYYKYPSIYDDITYKNQYFFGSQLMVAPIVTKKDVIMNRTIQKFFIPDGVWYDFKTGKKFPGNKKYVNFFKDENYPVFARSGSIIPLSNISNKNNIGNPSELEIHIFPGMSNTYILYEDDGTTSLYKEGYFLKTSIDYNYLANNYTLLIRSIEGKSGIVPDVRTYKIRFRNTKQASEVIVYFNDTIVETESYVDDADFVVLVKNVPSIGQLTINCKGKDIEIDAVRLINEDIDSILLDLQIETYLKDEISNVIFGELPIKKKRIEIRKLRRRGLSQSYIKLFLKLLEYIEEI